MPRAMAVHKNVDGLTTEAVAGAHQRDLELQSKYGVKYLTYWLTRLKIRTARPVDSLYLATEEEGNGKPSNRNAPDCE